MGKALKLLGNRINLFMAAKGWKQVDLQRATEIGQTQISNYINGKVPPNLETIEVIAKALNRPIADFFKEEIIISEPSELMAEWQSLTEIERKDLLRVMKGLNEKKKSKAGEKV